MFGNVFDNFDIKSLFDTTTTLGQIVELVIYAVIAMVVTTIVLLIYGKFVKNRLKAKNNLTIRFTQNIIRVAIILIAVIWVLVSSTIWPSVVVVSKSDFISKLSNTFPNII